MYKRFKNIYLQTLKAHSWEFDVKNRSASDSNTKVIWTSSFVLLSVWQQGWREGPGWWRDSGVSLWPALVAFHSLYTWEETDSMTIQNRSITSIHSQTQCAIKNRPILMVLRNVPGLIMQLWKLWMLQMQSLSLNNFLLIFLYDKLYLVICPSGEVKVMQETPTWTISWDPSLNWTHTSPLVS